MAAIPMVFGVRTAYEETGALAISCPACGEIVIADAVKILKSQRVFFFRGKYREAGAYARCRLCAVPSSLPPGIHLKVFPDKDSIVPSKSFITETNESLLSLYREGLNNKSDPRRKLYRHLYALFHGILYEINRQKSLYEVTGNADVGMHLTLAAVSIGLYPYFYNHFRSNLFLVITVPGAIGALGIYLLYKYRWRLIYRASHRFLGYHLRRFLSYEKLGFDDLLHFASGLGWKFGQVKNYLKWVKSRKSDYHCVEAGGHEIY